VSRPGLLLVLDGPSAVGRTTTLRALADVWPDRRGGTLLEAGLDAAVAALGAGPGVRLAPLLDRVEHGPAGAAPRLRRGPLARELVAGMHRAAAAWAVAGFDVGMDHLLTDAAAVADLRAVAAGLPLLVVGLTCDPVVLEDRERRDGRPVGRAAAETAVLAAAASQAAAPVHDAVLDTTAMTTDELVEAVLDLVARAERDGRLSRT
jgi:chloramphenicol 3-O-phosphotransferase